MIIKQKPPESTASNIEQVPEAALHKAVAVRLPTTHHKNYPSLTNQTRRTLLKK